MRSLYLYNTNMPKMILYCTSVRWARHVSKFVDGLVYSFGMLLFFFSGLSGYFIYFIQRRVVWFKKSAEIGVGDVCNLCQIRSGWVAR